MSDAPHWAPARAGLTTAAEPNPSGAPAPVTAQDSIPAREPAVLSAVPARVVQHWYGWQTLTADGLALTLAVGGAAVVDAPMAGMGGVIYVLGGPVVHVTHGRWGAAGGSLALRVGLPVVFAVVGSGIEPCGPDENGDTCGLRGPALGALLGIGTAMAVDSALLAHEELPALPERSLARRLSPVVAINAKRAFFGVGAEF